MEKVLLREKHYLYFSQLQLKEHNTHTITLDLESWAEATYVSPVIYVHCIFLYFSQSATSNVYLSSVVLSSFLYHTQTKNTDTYKDGGG